MSDSSPPVGPREDLDFDPAQVFARLLHYYRNNPTDMGRVDVSEWRGSEEVAAATQRLAQRIRRSGIVTRRQFVDAMSRPMRAFSLLRAIDIAFRSVDPHNGTHDRGRLGGYRQKFRKSKCYYGDEKVGYVLPRRCFPTRPQPVPDHLTEHLESLMLVPKIPDHLHFDLLTSRPELDFEEAARKETIKSKKIKVGCVPFIDNLGELDITPIDRADAWYSIRLKRGDNDEAREEWTRHWRERSGRALVNLDQSGAHIGVLPELALTDDLLAWWQETLQHTPRPRESRLQWILVGTGPLTTGPGADPQPNRATLLHRRTGEVIFQQDKCEPFTLSDDQIEHWQLSALKPGPRAEWMRDSRDRYVLDAWAGRFAVLVCEDLSRVMEVGTDLSALGPTHLFIPIFAPPIIRHRWQQQSAVQFANTVGSVSIVANSQAVRPLPNGDGPPRPGDVGTALAILPVGRGPSDTWTVRTHIRHAGEAVGVAKFILPRS